MTDDTESGRTVHTFSLVIRIHELNQEYNQTEKVKAHLTARSSPPPSVITPAKKTETVRGFVGLNISRLNIRRY